MHENSTATAMKFEPTSIQRKELVEQRIPMLETGTKSRRTLRTACPPDLALLNTALCRRTLQTQMAHNHLDNG